MESFKVPHPKSPAESPTESLADPLADSLANPRAHSLVDSQKESSTPAEELLTAGQTRYVTEHLTCAMCDSALEIRHEIHRDDLKVKEEAHCPSCGIRVRSSHHLMH